MPAIASDLRLYRSQMINFLNTLSIKFTPLATSLNAYVLNNGGTVDGNNPQTWKYYLNLVGQYHPIDTVMMIASLDTREQVPFSQETLAAHPRTKEAYIPGSTYYTKLCERYPAQVDLVKSIVFPAPDIEACIDAEDFTILSYGSGFLETAEEGYIVDFLTRTLSYISYRWYLSYLAFEPYFNVTFWGQLWHRLFEAVQTARLMALRTVNVHSWHIWQYLQSFGLDDYSDILSREKSLFLYRNMDYLIANRGKQSNLVVLEDKLLGDLSVGLFGRDVYQQTKDGAATYQLIPELVAVPIVTDTATSDESVPAETISDMNVRLIAAGDEVDSSSEHIAQVQDQLATTTLNTYPTKLLELRPLPRDRKYAEFFNVFMMDSLVYLINSGYYTTNVELYTNLVTESAELSAKDALVLLYYCIARSQYQTPELLPVFYTSKTAYRQTQLPIPSTFQWSGMTYQTKQFVDVDGWSADSVYPPSGATTPEQFSAIVSDLFLTAASKIIASRETSDLVTLTAQHQVIECLVYQGTFDLTLSSETTYTDWFKQHYDVYQNYIEVYERNASPQTNYSDLADLIITQLIPTTSIMDEYGNFSISDQGYSRLKNLFISLCSYNVTFLDTQRDVYQFLLLEEMALGSLKRELTMSVSDPLAVGVDIYSTAEDSMTLDIGDIEIALDNLVTGEVGVDLSFTMQSQTLAQNKAFLTTDPITKPMSTLAGNAIGVDISDTVAVGS